MSKQNNKKNKEKVIPFPNLKERLIEKGHEALANKRYRDALALLRQAQEIEKGHHEIELGIVICLFELGGLEEAKELCWKMLKEDIGDYFHVLQVYLMILVQLSQYNEVETTIEAVLDENSVPPEHLENLTQLLEFSKKMISSKINFEHEESVEESQFDQIHKTLLTENNVNAQLKVLQMCKDLNIRKYIEIFKEFLISPNKHAIMKTIIIQLMIANGITEKVKVEKFGDIIEVVPSSLKDPSDDPLAGKVLSILEDKLTHINPTLFHTAKDIWLRYLFVMFPFSIEEFEIEHFAGSLHYYSCLLQGINCEISEIENEYGITYTQLANIKSKIEEIEKISFFE